MKHNNVLPNGHFKEDSKSHVRTWFNQAARKKRICLAHQKKAVQIFSRPTSGPLRPSVHSQTLKYNIKVRAGGGFTLEKLASTSGIAVDTHRKNCYLESLQAIVFLRRSQKAKEADSSEEELASAMHIQGPTIPIVREKPIVEVVVITYESK
ncbi:hypothetical protein L7F22_051130 [Adiantum nelumboides]|nr:hypothetical protein [Adiantum nelumboides]